MLSVTPSKAEPCRTREWLLCAVVSAILATAVCFASDRINNRSERRAEAIQMELALLEGRSFYESGHLTYIPAFQNRILFPLLLKAGSSLNLLSLAGWYVLIRFLTAWAMLIAFWCALRRVAGANIKLASVGLLLLAYSLLFTFNLPLVLTSDFPDAAFTAIFILAALECRRWLLLGASVVAAANRESAVFAGVIWFFLHGWEKKARLKFGETAFAVLVSVLSYATVLLLRYQFGGARAIASNTQLITIKTNLYLVWRFLQRPWVPYSWAMMLAAMVLPAVLWIIINRKQVVAERRRLLIAAFVIALISAVFGIISEPRIFIPGTVLLTFVAVWSAAKSQRLQETTS